MDSTSSRALKFKSSRAVYPNEHEIKQRQQEVCMGEQDVPYKIRSQKGRVQEMAAGLGGPASR